MEIKPKNENIERDRKKSEEIGIKSLDEWDYSRYLMTYQYCGLQQRPMSMDQYELHRRTSSSISVASLPMGMLFLLAYNLR